MWFLVRQRISAVLCVVVFPKLLLCCMFKACGQGSLQGIFVGFGLVHPYGFQWSVVVEYVMIVVGSH